MSMEEPLEGCFLKDMGLLRIPKGSERVMDADEEIFLLYTELQAVSSTQNEGGNFRGLGHLDSRQDELVISLEIKPTESLKMKQSLKDAASPTSKAAVKRKQRKVRNSSNDTETIEIKIAQDKTSLRSRKGDTGSVLWRASVDFAQVVLQQLRGYSDGGMLRTEALKNAHILELGAGTGLLAVALSPHVRRYTVTDIPDLVPLLRKNMALNIPNWPGSPSTSSGSNITVTALDWMILHSTPPSLRYRIVDVEPVDLLLVVDCIYHPSLLPALVGTINHLARPNHTVVLVVVELRQEDVIREFLQLWLKEPTWEIWRLDQVLGRPYAVWAGWKNDATVTAEGQHDT